MPSLTQRAAATDARTLAYAGLSVSTFGWAAAFIAGKVALADMTPLSVAVWRYALASTVLLPFAVWQRPARGIGRAVAPLALMVVCGGVLYPWLFLLALAHTSATNTALLIALNPVFTLLLSPLVGEPLDRRRLDGRVRLPRAGADRRPVDDAARRAVPPRPGGGRLGGPRRRLLDDAGVALLRVGLAVSLTGPLAPRGTCARRGLELWADEARGAGRAVELIVRDDQRDAR